MNVSEGRTYRIVEATCIMPEHLLDRDQVHAALVVVGRAGPPQRMRGEPVTGGPALEFHQVPEPVADRPGRQLPSGLVTEQRGRAGEPAMNDNEEPAQLQVQAVQHRHPPRPGPGRARRLAAWT